MEIHAIKGLPVTTESTVLVMLNTVSPAHCVWHGEGSL